MTQRGRKSAAAAETPDITVVKQLAPPEELGEEQKKVWTRIVSDMRDDWFTRYNMDLLVQYCEHVVEADRIRVETENMKAIGDDLEIVTRLKVMDSLGKARERESRILASLATKMRLTQQATYDRERVKGASGTGGKKRPWQA